MNSKAALLILLFVKSAFLVIGQTHELLNADELKRKIDELEKESNARIQADDERYDDCVKTITKGLQNASDIQILLPNSLLLLAFSDLKTLQSEINNPTYEGLGQKFTDQIVESASEYLIREYDNEKTLKKEETSKGKFKKFLTGVFNNPIFQGLMHSNPITGFISSAVEHAGVFEKPRTAEVTLTRRDIRQLSSRGDDNYSEKFGTTTVSNTDGPGYDEAMMDKFYKSLKARINFYEELLDHTDSVQKMNTELKVEAYSLQKQIKTGRTVICSTLGIDESDYINSLNALLGGRSKKQWLRDKQFEKAVLLSNQANEFLPEVIDLHMRIVKGAIADVKGYKWIIGKYIKNEDLLKDAKLEKDKLESIILRLNKIQGELESYLPKKDKK